MGFAASVTLLCLTLVCSLSSALDFTEDVKLQEDIGRMLRAAERDGYMLATLHEIDHNTGVPRRLSRRDVNAHASHPSASPRQMALHLASGERLRMSLKKRSVISSATTVEEQFRDKRKTFFLTPRNCYFTGPTEEAGGFASLSFCDGQVRGSVHTPGRQYAVQTLTRSGRIHKRSTDSLHVLVTWTNTARTRHVDKRGAWDGDGLEIPSTEEEPWQHNIIRKSTKDAANRTVTVEVAHFMDSDFINVITGRYNIRTTQELVDLSIMKWSGVAAVLSDPETVGWDINIKLVHIAIWRENPNWYETKSTDTLGTRMNKICVGTKHRKYDHVTVSTSKVHDGRNGVAWIGSVCSKRFRCAAVQSANLGFWTEVHEFGHSLGLHHDGVLGCKERAGFMGSDAFFFPQCYRPRLDKYLTKKRCLKKDLYRVLEAHPDPVDPLPLFSGQQYSLNRQCQILHGDEFEYFHMDSKLCTRLLCLASDVDSPSYKQLVRSNPMTGTPCGPELICAKRWVCKPLNETAVNLDKVRPLIADGSWGPWSEFSPCYAEPDGLPIRVARRYCNDPAPERGAFCEGLEYKAELCSQPSSVQEPDEVVIRRMADMVCGQVKARSADSDLTGQGKVVDSSGDVDSCLASCQRRNKKWTKQEYLMPDTAPCALPDAFRSRRLGLTYRCVAGRCLTFGCDGASLGAGAGAGAVLDACGVCGGDGRSCVHGTLSEPLEPQSSRRLVVLPVGASDIDISLQWGQPRKMEAYIELWTKDDPALPVISYTSGPRYQHTGSNPANFAGTHWYFKKDWQFLRAQGPLDQPVQIRLENVGSHSVSKVFYRYHVSQEVTPAPAECLNDGVPVAGGCQCSNNFFGHRCEHRCELICENGATLDPETCACACNERQEGRTCACKPQFSGADCTRCSGRCKNGGVMDPVTCKKCKCPVNCQGRRCRGTCADRASFCQTGSEKCKRRLYSFRCKRSCGVCEHDPSVNNGECRPA